MAFKLSETDKLDLIPDCIDAKFVSLRNRGAVEDLWDRGFDLSGGTSSKPYTVSYLLLIAVGLLGLEWLTRKIVRLA